MQSWARAPQRWRELLAPRQNSPRRSNPQRELTNWSEWETRWRASIPFIGLTTSSLLAAIPITEDISSHSKASTWKSHSISNAPAANWKANNSVQTIWGSSGAQKLGVSTAFVCFAPFRKVIRQFFLSSLNCLFARIWLGHSTETPASVTSFALAYTRKAIEISPMNGLRASPTSVSTPTKTPWQRSRDTRLCIHGSSSAWNALWNGENLTSIQSWTTQKKRCVMSKEISSRSRLRNLRTIIWYSHNQAAKSTKILAQNT